MSGELKHVEVDHGQMLFQESNRGRITEEDRNVMLSVHLADRLSQFQPRPFPPFPPVLQEYAAARISGARESRDPEFHRRIGLWTYSVRWIRDQNQADVSGLRWIGQFIEKKGMIDRYLAIEAKIAEYETIRPEHEAIAVRVQHMDWLAKLRERGQ